MARVWQVKCMARVCVIAPTSICVISRATRVGVVFYALLSVQRAIVPFGFLIHWLVMQICTFVSPMIVLFCLFCWLLFTFELGRLSAMAFWRVKSQKCQGPFACRSVDSLQPCPFLLCTATGPVWRHALTVGVYHKITHMSLRANVSP